MTSAGSSAETLSGPVDVCVDRPLLSLDRPFTYELPVELDAGIGSLVQVPFHGRATRGWVLGPGRRHAAPHAPVRKVVSPVRFFDDRGLALLRWVSERYVAPLAAVIARAIPPRVASEETASETVARHPTLTVAETDARVLDGYRRGDALLRTSRGGRGRSPSAPPPRTSSGAPSRPSRRAWRRSPGRRARPGGDAGARDRDRDPDAFGDRAALFLGGDKRTRYRTWLEIAAGRYDVVIGTRPAVFAPVERLGLVYVGRESHPAHREDRAPYYHVRDVALRRARLEDGVCSSPRRVRPRRPRRSACPRSRRPRDAGRRSRSSGPVPRAELRGS